MTGISGQWVQRALDDAHGVLLRCRELQEAGDRQAAEALMAEQLDQLCGLSRSAVCVLTPKHIRPTLLGASGIDRRRTLQLGLLVRGLAVDSADAGLAMAAASLVAFAAEDLEYVDITLGGLLEEAVCDLDLRQLGDATLQLLAGALVATGRYGRADRVTQEWVDRDAAAASEHAMKLYDRMNQVNDQELAAGGFSRQGLFSGLDFLAQALGRGGGRRPGSLAPDQDDSPTAGRGPRRARR